MVRFVVIINMIGDGLAWVAVPQRGANVGRHKPRISVYGDGADFDGIEVENREAAHG
jgi:hypothetical protein